jgi:hypothetical protein
MRSREGGSTVGLGGSWLRERERERESERERRRQCAHSVTNSGGEGQGNKAGKGTDWAAGGAIGR